MNHMNHGEIRIPIFILSLLINSLGIVLITQSMLGTSPISGIPYVLSLYLPFTYGQLTFVLNTLFVLGEVLLLGRHFPPVQYLQIGVTFIFSISIDFWMHLFSFLRQEPLWLSFLLLLAGCMILAFGICLEVAAQVLLVPGEGIVRVISMKGNWRMGSTKVIFDITLCLIAAILSNLFGGLGTFTGLGLGTIISALLVGRFVNLYNHNLFFLEKIADLSLDRAEKRAPSPAALRMK